MIWFPKKRPYPIGVDMGEDSLRLVQLGKNGKSINVVAGGSENCPADIKYGSADWLKWATEVIRDMISKGGFRGREVIVSLSESEVFLDLMKMPKVKESQMDEKILAKIKQRLPFDSESVMIKHIPTEDDSILVIATERQKIDRILAMYEKTNLCVQSIGVWPIALANTYARFFCRRKGDTEAIVMLLNIEIERTNVVICRAQKLLFAHSIPIGFKQLEDDEEVITTLLLELTACMKQLNVIQKNIQIERLVFFCPSSLNGISKSVCMKIAKQLETPAQMADCLAAVKMVNLHGLGIERRDSQSSWATAFGLSLS
ncbi:MAG: pilus assembly protein PilM [Planctomycetota bacterium]|jgi:Tfp pilus assembly PilM family ATPase